MSFVHAARRPAPVQTVLLAHNDADSRAMYRAMLEGLSFAIEECEDGAAALSKAIARKPDLLIASMTLARIDGLALCRMLRSDPATRSIRIVLLTTTDHPGDIVRAKSAGADVTLPAACTIEAIAAAMREAAEQARADSNRATPSPQSEPAPAGESRHRPRTRTIRREQTTSPPLAPPSLHCPSCQSPLIYQHSQTGGVNESAFEQWDYFRCHVCGPFQYRHRTRKLRAT